MGKHLEDLMRTPALCHRAELAEAALLDEQELRERVAELEAEVAALKGEARWVVYAQDIDADGAIEWALNGDACETAKLAEVPGFDDEHVYAVTLSARRAG